MIPSDRSYQKTFLCYGAPLLICTIMTTFLGLVGGIGPNVCRVMKFLARLRKREKRFLRDT
jgi:hypothetical protein